MLLRLASLCALAMLCTACKFNTAAASSLRDEQPPGLGALPAITDDDGAPLNDWLTANPDGDLTLLLLEPLDATDLHLKVKADPAQSLADNQAEIRQKVEATMLKSKADLEAEVTRVLTAYTIRYKLRTMLARVPSNAKIRVLLLVDQRSLVGEVNQIASDTAQTLHPFLANLPPFSWGVASRVQAGQRLAEQQLISENAVQETAAEAKVPAAFDLKMRFILNAGDGDLLASLFGDPGPAERAVLVNSAGQIVNRWQSTSSGAFTTTDASRPALMPNLGQDLGEAAAELKIAAAAQVAAQ